MDKKIVSIIGGSGFVGRAISKRALAAGHQVRVACRHPERVQDMKVEGVKLYKANVTDGTGLDAAIAGADVVVNLVGVLHSRGSNTFEAAHVDGAQHVLQACKRADVKHYVHVSALGAAANPASSYARTKSQAEQLVQAGDTPWTIFRPSVIYGAGDSFFCKIKPLLAMAPVLPVFAPAARFQPVWVEDVARAMVLALGNPACFAKAYTLAGPTTYSMQDLMQLLMHVLGYQRMLIPVPAMLANVVAACTQWLPSPVITLDQLRMLQTDNVVPDGEASFPAIFGEAASLEHILPTYIQADAAGRLQRRLDTYRKNAR